MDINQIYNLFLLHPTITTDSRNCPEGAIFFALKGANFNGNKFAKETIEKGCSYAFVDEAEYADEKQIFYVPNCLTTLQQLATKHRMSLNTPIIGVTGTNGKTTTKELIASVLKQKYNILYTQGNLNNHIGVPTTLLQLKKEHEIAIIEMGANHPGEIKTLVNIARPNYGIITNVGKAHIEGFGSFEGVINTKCELYDFLKDNNGQAFVNHGNEILTGKATEKNISTIPYGKGSNIDAEILSSDPFLAIQWKDYKIQTQLIGRYNFENIVAAIAIGKQFQVADEQIVKAIENYTPTNNRSQFKKTEQNELIIDAYNANPTSMNASLDNFILIQKSDKAVILGDMKELGVVSETEHQKVADKLENSSINEILLIGPNFAKTNCPKAKKFNDVVALNQYLSNSPIKGKLILVKGSNSMKLIECVNLL
ncbi:MAG: UDP-N-acetylmuramoyl-tripeptide--D-alanyl-D-alanine ligase [Paludibacteraceae bacterium]|nr:UDP-N-acetylmuramoyl-tripeptide--D-alanyl-D-alanine ligase [Paludibacteraceae bacterium]